MSEKNISKVSLCHFEYKNLIKNIIFEVGIILENYSAIFDVY